MIIRATNRDENEDHKDQVKCSESEKGRTYAKNHGANDTPTCFEMKYPRPKCNKPIRNARRGEKNPDTKFKCLQIEFLRAEEQKPQANSNQKDQCERPDCSLKVVPKITLCIR